MGGGGAGVTCSTQRNPGQPPSLRNCVERAQALQPEFPVRFFSQWFQRVDEQKNFRDSLHIE